MLWINNIYVELSLCSRIHIRAHLSKYVSNVHYLSTVIFIGLNLTVNVYNVNLFAIPIALQKKLNPPTHRD